MVMVCIQGFIDNRQLQDEAVIGWVRLASFLVYGHETGLLSCSGACTRSEVLLEDMNERL